MEINIISYLAIVSLIVAFVFNTLIKWGVFEFLQVLQGSKWYIPMWLRVDCMYCMALWTCILIGSIITYSFNLHWGYYFLSILAQQITIQIVKY